MALATPAQYTVAVCSKTTGRDASLVVDFKFTGAVVTLLVLNGAFGAVNSGSHIVVACRFEHLAHLMLLLHTFER